LEAASSPSAAAASAGGGSSSIGALEKVSASVGAAGVTTDDGGHHCQGERLVKSTEASGRNGVAAATAGALMDAADSQGVAGPGSGKLLKSKDCLVPSVRLLPEPTTVSANRRFPPERQVSSSVTLHEATECVVEAYASHTSGAERIGNRWHCEERRSSAVPTTIDSNMTNKPGGSLCNVAAAESLAQGL
jgi:hypothetical protein